MLSGKSIDRIYKQARSNGFLNLVGRELNAFPPDCCNLMDHILPDEKFWECVDLYKIDISINSISELPSEVQQLEFITYFKMAQNRFKVIPECILELGNLVYLDISSNCIEGPLNAGIRKLTQLKELNVSKNKITALCDEIGYLNTLEVLNMEQNACTVLPESIGHLVQLKKLLASENRIQLVPESIRNLNRLDTLLLNKNAIEVMPDGLMYLDKLQFLDVRQNRLCAFPKLPKTKDACLHQLFLGYNRISLIPEQALDSIASVLFLLDVRDNKLRELPSVIGKLVCLKTLDISNNDLSDLPASIGYLKKLDRLVVDGNPMRAIRQATINAGHHELKKYLRSRGAPAAGVDVLDQETDEFSKPEQVAESEFEYCIREAMGTKKLALDNKRLQSISSLVLERRELLENLTSINLAQNQLTRIPIEFGTCAMLQNLVLDNNAITALPMELHGLQFLKSLSLLNNTISTLALEDFCAVGYQSPLSQVLEVLDLRQNKLNTIPNSLTNLNKLHTLTLACNKLTSLAGFPWTEMNHLVSFSASDNQLQDIGCVHHIPSLQSLNIENNNLKQIPIDLGLCSNLHSLLLSGNPQRSVPVSTISKGTVAILKYLRMKLPEHQESFCESKVPPSTASRIKQVRYSETKSQEAPQHQVENPETVQANQNLLNKYDREIADLEERLANEFSITQAKKYALKKDLAKVRSLRIREARKC